MDIWQANETSFQELRECVQSRLCYSVVFSLLLYGDGKSNSNQVKGVLKTAPVRAVIADSTCWMFNRTALDLVEALNL